MLTTTATFTAPWGRSVTLAIRPGRNDYNVLNACIGHDEYHLARIGQPGALLIDLGAHIGGVSVAATTLGMRVVAVEALPDNIELLTRNLASAGATDATVVNKAIYHTAGETVTMQLNDPGTESGFVHEFVGQLADAANASQSTRTVPSVTLAELYAGVDHCRVLKIDVEGAEWDCFRDVPDSVLDRTEYIVGELHLCPRANGGSPLDFLALFRGRFRDVSTEFGELGFAAAAETGNGLFNFVLQHV